MSKTKVRGNKKDARKSRTEIIAEKEREAFHKDVQKVKRLFLKHDAEDLIAMITPAVEDYPTSSLPESLNGRK